MRKYTWVLGVVFVLAVLFTTNAFAEDGGNAVSGFLTSTGEFISKLFPWNWGK